jgi:predicted metal-dependent hydrolase
MAVHTNAMPTRAARLHVPPQPPPTVEVAGRRVDLAVRRSPRARRLYLRVDPMEAHVELILPRGVGLPEGLRFVNDKRGWLASRLAAIPARTPFADGTTIALFGEPVTIRHRPEMRGAVRREGSDLVVSGAAEHVARRVRDWLKDQARRELSARSHAVAARIGRQVTRVRISDPCSRWGSCSARGGLAYSWRLALAPPYVADYVVAHEVAHLVEHNHGRRFWRLVEQLMPSAEEAKAWLRRNGNVLLRYG